MQFNDLLKKKEADLQKMLGDERAKLYALRLKASVNQLSKMSEFKTVKKSIAQIQTAISRLRSDN
jgi:ribosomal protein L29